MKFIQANLNERVLVIHDNQKYLGDLIKEADGYYHWWMTVECLSRGSWPSYVLREIADKLDELNKEWDEEVRRGLQAANRDP
jgi:hypothetical protein